MSLNIQARLNWGMHRACTYLGHMGLLGLAIVGICLSQISAIEHMQGQLEQLDKIIAHKHQDQPQKIPEDTVTHVLHQLNSFYQTFPEKSDMTGQIENVFAAAKRYNLDLEHGGYEVTPGNTHKLAKCEIQLPIKGSYTQVRQFLADVLQEMPNLAVSGVDIQRQKIGDTSVEAQVRLTLYYREA